MAIALRRFPTIVYLTIVGVISLAINTAQVLAYTGVSGLRSLWSGTSGFFTLRGGSVGVITLDFQTISESTQSVAISIPTIFGLCVVVALFVGLTLKISNSVRLTIVVAIAGIVGLIGVILLQNIVTSLLGG